MRSAFGVEHGQISKTYGSGNQKKMSVGGNAAALGGAGLVGAAATDLHRGAQIGGDIVHSQRKGGRAISAGRAGAMRAAGALGHASGALRARPGLAIGALGGGAILGGSMASAHNKKMGLSKAWNKDQKVTAGFAGGGAAAGGVAAHALTRGSKLGTAAGAGLGAMGGAAAAPASRKSSKAFKREYKRKGATGWEKR